jgi:hypothetical protein
LEALPTEGIKIALERLFNSSHERAVKKKKKIKQPGQLSGFLCLLIPTDDPNIAIHHEMTRPKWALTRACIRL